MKILMLSTHSMKYIWYSPLKVNILYLFLYSDDSQMNKEAIVVTEQLSKCLTNWVSEGLIVRGPKSPSVDSAGPNSPWVR